MVIRLAMEYLPIQFDTSYIKRVLIRNFLADKLNRRYKL